MLRRVVFAVITALMLASGRAEAVTIRDLIELSKAGLSDPVLLALIDVNRSVFSIDTATLKQLKEAGVSDQVIVALIQSGRQRSEPVAAAAPDPLPREREPEVIVIDHRDAPVPAPQPVAYPVAVPVYIPVAAPSRRSYDTVTTIIPTDQGLVRARVPVPQNCVKAAPVYWGFDGKLRPGSWEPPPTVVCR